MIVNLRQTQWLLYLKTEQSAVPLPLLVALVAWLAAIFLSFGLFAAPNSTTIATLTVSALAVSAAIFLILEMYTPFSGVLKISPRPILEALSQMGR
jgi:nitric oxide reductase large subunit